MHSCQTESRAVAEHSLKYFTCAFVHPSSSTEMPPQFSPKHFSSEHPLHFICTIATAHLNFKLSLRTFAFNSYKNCLLHHCAHPFWPSSWGLGYLCSLVPLLQVPQLPRLSFSVWNAVLFGLMVVTRAELLAGTSPHHIHLIALPPSEFISAYKEPSLMHFPFIVSYCLPQFVFVKIHLFDY